MYYLDISLIIPNNKNRQISQVFLKKHLMQSLKQVFGEKGSNCCIDIIKYNQDNRNFILRCKNEDYVRLRSSLTLASTYEEDNCIYIVNKSSVSPFGLLSDGRDYQH
ncbi:hypothetical protein HCN44_002885 [Aphidius gifuensis]|uniref:Uncharacterized protein n=1 Tax=Aphidius gifuensis TaxID=684658 RepID=A0A835CRL2_APHGI|nr:ribonuclease P protein subunit p14 [Aphidius gifuensis]KAF7991323.1 hypothetical protein HCN44_002885 [Aphidius gifuensis]